MEAAAAALLRLRAAPLRHAWQVAEELVGLALSGGGGGADEANVAGAAAGQVRPPPILLLWWID